MSTCLYVYWSECHTNFVNALNQHLMRGIPWNAHYLNHGINLCCFLAFDAVCISYGMESVMNTSSGDSTVIPPRSIEITMDILRFYTHYWSKKQIPRTWNSTMSPMEPQKTLQVKKISLNSTLHGIAEIKICKMHISKNLSH